MSDETKMTGDTSTTTGNIPIGRTCDINTPGNAHIRVSSDLIPPGKVWMVNLSNGSIAELDTSYLVFPRTYNYVAQS